MKVYVNDIPVELLPGMTVRHALIKADVFEEIERGKKVCDEWGNEIGLDGGLTEGVRIFVIDEIKNTE